MGILWFKAVCEKIACTKKAEKILSFIECYRVNHECKQLQNILCDAI